jgi:glycosyltransferase involved in cell wall biosynthesis
MIPSNRVSEIEPKQTVLPKLASTHAVRKVFFLVDSLNVGGTETQAVELALRMPDAGYEVTLGCLRAEGPLREKLVATPVRLMQFYPAGGIDSSGGIYQMLRLSWFLRRERFQIVHTHDLWSNLLGIPAAFLARVPVKVSGRRDLAHFEWYQGSRRKWLRRLLNLSDVILANASAIRDSLTVDDEFPLSKIRVIPNGIDVDKFKATSNNRELLFPGCADAPLVVLVGNMHTDVKGHPWVIGGASVVLREFPKTRFVFVGDGEQRGEFEKQVRQLGLGEHFVFLGRRSDITEILASCDVGILPSRTEGMSNALLEYMAAGLPVVASRVGGSSEIVQAGVTGLLIPPEDSPALGKAILKLLRDEKGTRKMGLAGQEFVAQNFSFERLVQNVDQLYTELLGGKGNH